MNKLVVRSELRKQVLRAMHDTRIGGHVGRNKTVARLTTFYFWPGMSRGEQAYVETCHICQMNEKIHACAKARFGTLPSLY